MTTHSLYSILQTCLNTRDLKIGNTNFCSAYGLKSDNLIYNLGGNISVTCQIPLSGVPNYFLPFNSDKSDFFKLLFSFIEDANGLSTYPVANLTTNNNVPNIDLKTYVMNKEICINWNNGRTGLTLERFKEIVLYFIQMFNELIDYVITNDIDKVTSEFKNKVQKIFADTSGNVFDYSVYTLILPATINYLAGILNRPKFAANAPLGYIP
jgi:hypothetical protein